MQTKEVADLKRKAESFTSMTEIKVHLYDAEENHFLEMERSIFMNCSCIGRLVRSGKENIMLAQTSCGLMYGLVRDDNLRWVIGPVMTDADKAEETMRLIAEYNCAEEGLMWRMQEQVRHTPVVSRINFEYFVMFFAGTVAGRELSKSSEEHVIQNEVILIPDEKCKCKDESLADCRDYIHAHLGETLSLQILADYFGYNPAYFSRKFKQAYGVNLNKYIQNARMELAAKQLKETDKPLVEISENLCFATQSHFQNTFKSVYHMTPLEYRKKQKKRKSYYLQITRHSDYVNV